MSESDKVLEQHSFEEFELDGSPVSEHLSEIVRLPGYWEADEECTKRKPTGFCESGHVQLGSAKPCSTRTCSLHWYQWRQRAAESLVARLAAYRYAQGDEWDRQRRLLHVISSPDQEQRWTVNRFWQERSESCDPVKEAGGRGGVVVPHPYRVSEAGNELYYEWLAKKGQDRGKWSVLREFTETWEEMQKMVTVAPHFHHLTAAEDIDGDVVAEIEDRTGRAVHNVRSLAPFYIDEDEVPRRVRHGRNGADEIVREGYEDMARLAMYLLSHAAVQPETGELSMRQTVTYWGEVHPSSFDPEEELTEAEWREIQERAAEAVGDAPEEESEEVGQQGRCSRDGCEEAVRPLSELPDRLADPDHTWWDSLESEQQLELLGVYQWLGDRPPPGGERGELPPGGFGRSPSGPDTESREDWLQWLRRKGRRCHERRKFPFLSVGIDEGEVPS